LENRQNLESCASNAALQCGGFDRIQIDQVRFGKDGNLNILKE
jgi:hypothetical protein